MPLASVFGISASAQGGAVSAGQLADSSRAFTRGSALRRQTVTASASAGMARFRLRPYPRGDRQLRPADELPPLPPRPLAIHAQRLYQRVRHDQAGPRTRRQPVAVSADRGTDRLPRSCSSSPSPSACRRPARRNRACRRARRGYGTPHRVANPFQGTIATTSGEAIWAFRYSRGKIALALLHDRRADTSRALPERESLEEVSEDARIVVSEPLGEIPSISNEVPEATCQSSVKDTRSGERSGRGRHRHRRRASACRSSPVV